MDNKKSLKVFRNSNNHLSEVGVGLGEVLGAERERTFLCILFSTFSILYVFKKIKINK